MDWATFWVIFLQTHLVTLVRRKSRRNGKNSYTMAKIQNVGRVLNQLCSKIYLLINIYA
jgi:hypothetical protein